MMYMMQWGAYTHDVPAGCLCCDGAERLATSAVCDAARPVRVG